MTENYKLTQEEFDTLFDDNATVKQQKEVIAKVADRFNYVMHKMADIIGRTIEWFDYDNEGGKGSEQRGFFDPEIYKDSISFVGEFNVTRNRDFTSYEYEIPTVWLTKDFEKELGQEVAQFAHEEAQKAQQQKDQSQQVKQNMKDMQTTIYAKLTPEERCYMMMAPQAQVVKALYSLEQQQKREALSNYKSYKAPRNK